MSEMLDIISMGFIPFNSVDEDNFIDAVDRDHSIFFPDIINSIEGEDEDNYGKE